MYRPTYYLETAFSVTQLSEHHHTVALMHSQVERVTVALAALLYEKVSQVTLQCKCDKLRILAVEGGSFSLLLPDGCALSLTENQLSCWLGLLLDHAVVCAFDGMHLDLETKQGNLTLAIAISS